MVSRCSPLNAALSINLHRKKDSMREFLIKYVVTRKLGTSIKMILVVSILFFLVGWVPLLGEDRLSGENWYLLTVNTAKFAMWFFLGYGGFQALGVRFEVSKLNELEEEKYFAHARVDFEPWTQMNRDLQDEETLKEVQKIDNQRLVINGDEETSLWLFGFGVFLFLATSISDVLYLAYK